MINCLGHQQTNGSHRGARAQYDCRQCDPGYEQGDCSGRDSQKSSGAEGTGETTC